MAQNRFYNVGDEVIYQPFSGGCRRVRVTCHSTHKAKDAFSGVVVSNVPEKGLEVWGYDHQIFSVISNTPQRPMVVLG